MKKLATLVLLLLAANLSFAQSTEILPGSFLPKMTTAQRMAFWPENGAMVFDTNTQSYWYRKNATWVELAGGASSYWQLSGLGGNEIQNTNTGGFWSKNQTLVDFLATSETNPPVAPVNEAGTRLMWIPSRSAFRAGTTLTGSTWAPDSIGIFSFAAGVDAQASGFSSFALGAKVLANNQFATAFGYGSKAKGHASMATGYASIASGDQATAIGNGTEAAGVSTVAIGIYAKAKGGGSMAMGYNANSTGLFASALGYETKTSGDYSMALGAFTSATSVYSMAMGYNSLASGDSVATALGNRTIAKGRFSTAMGNATVAEGIASLATGHKTVASGEKSTAMGSLMNTNFKKGAYMIGDSDPDNEGVTLIGMTDQFVARFKNGYYLMTSGNANPRTGVQIASGQTAWSAISDSTRKEKFLAADGEVFLAKLRGLRLGSWNYKNQKTYKPERFYGPMAQEIFAAFGKDSYGTIGTDTTVSTLNMDGLLFIFSQALEKRTQQLLSENQQLKQSDARLAEENQLLKTMIQKLDARLEAVESNLSPASLSTEKSRK